MGYRTLRECVDDLDRTGQLVRIHGEVDANLEVAAIQRRVYAAGGPAIYYERVRGCQFPLVSNLFGTIDRARFLFRDTLAAVRQLVDLKVDPSVALRHPWRYRRAPLAALSALPKRVHSAAVMANEISVDRVPAVRSWPDDGGAFVTLPAVYTEDVERPGWQRSNLGMYRVQLTGGQYQLNREIGLHYQIHRGIGVHHAAALRRGVPLRVNIYVGGPPALMLAAVMPLPEGLAELSFAGALGGRRVGLFYPPGQLPVVAEADFCISGTVDPDRLLPEGPFGDHLGYYSLAHDFPVLRVEHVYHRTGAIWPFTVVGRPPQEDTTFGQLVHEITGPVIPTVVPGLHAVNAVDAAGVHPLLLAIGSERYVPFAERRRPQELLTIANAILGQGQMSLAKYLLIAAREDAPELDIHDIAAFLRHVLARVDWRRDLHFQTCTTIDTLDYSGSGLNEGSKLVIAAAGPAIRELPSTLPSALSASESLPEGFTDPRICLPGVLAIRAPRWEGIGRDDRTVTRFCEQLNLAHPINAFPLVVVVDDSRFTAESLGNFLWTTFTRSNPAPDTYGIESFVEQKHWGCRGSLVIDARAKPHHAPALIDDPEISRRVDRLGAPGGPLHGIL